MSILAASKNGVVVNLIKANPALIQNLDPTLTWDDVTNISPLPQIGWAFVSPGVYTSPIQAPFIPPFPVAVSQSTSDLLAAMLSVGVISQAQHDQMVVTLTPAAPVIAKGP